MFYSVPIGVLFECVLNYVVLLRLFHPNIAVYQHNRHKMLSHSDFQHWC
jgi:hypothetical protein